MSANQIAQVDVQLTPKGPDTTVEVTAEGGTLQVETAVRGSNIDTVKMTELPISTRNPVSLALTVPGVSSNRAGFGLGTFPVNGSRGRSNNFLIDGTENNDPSVAGQAFQINNPDAVQEVSVQTSNYDAEFGRSGGAVVNVVTKSGTNNVHGTAAYLYHTAYLDSITSSQSRNPDIVRRGHPPFGQEYFAGGTIGGPIIRNRTFFFFAYEQNNRRTLGLAQLITPTAAGRTQLRSFYPQGASANVDLLPDATQNVVAAASPFNVPLGVVGGVDRGNAQFGTFFRNYPATYTEPQFQVRLDHKLGEKDMLSGRFLSDRQSTLEYVVNLPGFDADGFQFYYNAQLAETHIFSPSMTNELRLAYNRITFDFPLHDPAGPEAVLPAINITSISPLGISSTYPQGRITNNYTIQDTVSKVYRTHTIRTGVDLLRQDGIQRPPVNSRGSLGYGASTGYSALANFADGFGGSGSAARTFGSPTFSPAFYRTGAFFQDHWRATEALTLTLGVRYENFGTPFNSIRTPAFAGLFNVDPQTLAGPYGRPNKVAADNNNFAPTIGVAYSPARQDGLLGRLFGNRRTVFRAGYQIGYESFYNNILSNAATSSPNVVATSNPSTVSAANPRGLPNLSAQFPTVAAPLSPLSAQTLIAPTLVNPYDQHWSGGIQRELPGQWILDISYVGSKGTKLFITEDANPLVPPTLRITPSGFTGATSGRLDNLQGQRNVRANGGASNYHAGQLNVKHRFSRQFTATAAYTYSKSMSNADDVFDSTLSTLGGISGPGSFQTPAVFGGERQDRAVSLYDRTHVAAFTYVYVLPFFKEQRGAVGHILGGFELSGITTFESGQPFTIVNGLDGDGIGGAGTDRPNLNPNGQPGVRAVPVVNAQGSITGYVNPDNGNAAIDPGTARFVANPAFTFGLPGSVPRVGTLGRNTQRSPGINNWDFNVLKRTKVRENISFELRAEFFNIFNHPQYGIAAQSVFAPGGNPLFGSFIPANVASSSAGQFLNPNTPFSDGGGRVARFQAKFIF